MEPYKQDEMNISRWEMINSKMDLVSPYSSEFVERLGYGDEIGTLGQNWAKQFEYLLYTGTAMHCVHGLYRMDSCTTMGRSESGCFSVGLDHARVWVSDNGMNAFVLAHTYAKSHITNKTISYADAHGLTVHSYAFDGWYPNTTPIRLSIPSNWPMWPIQRDAVVLLASQPIQWPTKEQRVSSND
jgi:hypothetical protein